MKRFLVLLPVALVAAGLMSGAPASAGDKEPPRTGFEESEGAEWTTHEQELSFLEAVDARSKRVEIEVIGKSVEGRPLHLVSVGHPAPKNAGAARQRPTTLFVCTQHGNEPAGREACLQTLRDLAFTDDPELEGQLKEQTILFIPTANPDGREANSRGNARDVDINRDHLNLRTPEAQAIAEVVRDWQPEPVVDLHEYGPSIPVLYDDEVLYLWPRNLNVDAEVHDLAKELAEGYIAVDSEEAGYSADEYGQYEVADQNVHQSAGGHDEGIARNLMGLRHTLGILVETAVTEDPRNGPDEVISEAAVRLRRVAAHLVVSQSVLRFMRERGSEAVKTTSGAVKRKIEEGRTGSAPVYFGGADNQEPAEEDVVDPPPCGYLLSSEQATSLKQVLKLHGIRTERQGSNTFVSMAQAAEPLIPLLLDARGSRSATEGEPLSDC